MGFATSTVIYFLLFGFLFGEIFGQNFTEEELHKERVESMKEYKSEPFMMHMWDMRQRTLRCCGVNSPEDWTTHAQIEIPLSCCQDGNNCQDDPESYFQQGCWSRVSIIKTAEETKASSSATKENSLPLLLTILLFMCHFFSFV